MKLCFPWRCCKPSLSAVPLVWSSWGLETGVVPGQGGIGFPSGRIIYPPFLKADTAIPYPSPLLRCGITLVRYLVYVLALKIFH